MIRVVPLAALATLALPAVLAAQQPAAPPAAPPPPPPPGATQSSRASVSVDLPGRFIAGRWFPAAAGVAGPSRITITYGQPHLRGRPLTQLVPMDSVWRTGANLATELSTDVALDLGGTVIPAGRYSLFTLPTRNGWKLIVNRQVAQWGTDYDAAQDVARIDLQSRTAGEPLESFTIWLVPDAAPRAGSGVGPASGTLRLQWDRTVLSTTWTLAAR